MLIHPKQRISTHKTQTTISKSGSNTELRNHIPIVLRKTNVPLQDSIPEPAGSEAKAPAGMPTNRAEVNAATPIIPTIF